MIEGYGVESGKTKWKRTENPIETGLHATLTSRKVGLSEGLCEV